MKIYCEHGATPREILKLLHDEQIEVVYFPYDPGSGTKRVAPTATPSEARVGDLNLTIDELTWALGDLGGSTHLPEIVRIIGPENRRDALHIDSAFKSGCIAFITPDRNHILKHKAALEALLGVRFFHPDDIEELRHFIADRRAAK